MPGIGKPRISGLVPGETSPPGKYASSRSKPCLDKGSGGVARAMISFRPPAPVESSPTTRAAESNRMTLVSTWTKLTRFKRIKSNP